MQENNMFYWQYSTNRFLNKSIEKNCSDRVLSILRNISFNRLRVIMVFIVMCTFLFSSMVTTASTLTSDMGAEVAAEFKKQLDLQTWPDMHTKLALMDNPYKKFDKAIRKKLKAEAKEGERRRLMTHEESIIKAKKKRFDYCQSSINFFLGFAKRAYTLSTVEDKPLTKDTLMKGNGVEYPFTEDETNNVNARPTQIALTLGWKHQGKGEEHAGTFLKTCLAIPVSVYYVEDKPR